MINDCSGDVTIAALEQGLSTAAQLVEIDPRALPIFERLDAELTAAKRRALLSELSDPVLRAREMSKLRRSQAA